MSHPPKAGALGRGGTSSNEAPSNIAFNLATGAGYCGRSSRIDAVFDDRRRIGVTATIDGNRLEPV